LQYHPPVSFAALLVAVMGLPSCVDQGQSHLAFASAQSIEDLPMPPPTPGQPPVDPKTSGRVVLVTLDGVRAEDVFDGANPSLRPGSDVSKYRTPEAVMPRTHALVATRGVALGAPLAVWTDPQPARMCRYPVISRSSRVGERAVATTTAIAPRRRPCSTRRRMPVSRPSRASDRGRCSNAR